MDKRNLFIDKDKINKGAVEYCNNITRSMDFDIEAYINFLNFIEPKHKNVFKKAKFKTLTAWYAPIMETLYLIADDEAYISDSLSDLLSKYNENIILTSNKTEKTFAISTVLEPDRDNVIKGVKIYG